MSKEKAPYYYKDDRTNDTYHWEKSCSKNHYPSSGWVKKDTKPYWKTDACNECKSK
jgi:hypothetical protein